MMLSLHERRALADIEEHLRASDPTLADMLEHSHGEALPQHCRALPRRCRARRATRLAGLVVGALLLALAIATRNADEALVAVTVLLVEAAWWTTLSIMRLIKSRAASGRGRQPR